MNTITPFSIIYDSFLSKITDDMYMELTELDTFSMLQELLLSAIPKFEFPRVDLNNYELLDIEDQITYKGIESENQLVSGVIYSSGYFNCRLNIEEINILSTYPLFNLFNPRIIPHCSLMTSSTLYTGKPKADFFSGLVSINPSILIFLLSII